MRTPDFAYAKTKTQISFAVNAKLISAFFFASQIVQSLHFLYPKFQASSFILWPYSPVCVRPGRRPRRPVFSQRGSIKCMALTRLPAIAKTDSIHFHYKDMEERYCCFCKSRQCMYNSFHRYKYCVLL